MWVDDDGVGTLPARKAMRAAPDTRPPLPRTRRRRGATRPPPRTGRRSPSIGSTDVDEVVPIVRDRRRTRRRDRGDLGSQAKSVVDGVFRGARGRAASDRLVDTDDARARSTRRRDGRIARHARRQRDDHRDEAVSSMCPCRPAGRPSSCASQSRRDRLQLLERGRRAPEEPDLVQTAMSSSARIARLRAGDGEVREEARALPVRDPGQQDSSRSRSTAENGSGSSGGAAGNAARIAPGSTCARTGSSRRRSRYEATHSRVSSPSSLKLTCGSSRSVARCAC